MMQCAWSSATFNQVNCFVWQAFCRILLPETFHTAKVNVWFWHNGCWFWFGSVKIFGNGEMKIESCIDILNNWVYHGWEGHAGVIMISVHLPLIALANTLPVRVKGGKAYAFRCVQFIWNAFTIHVCESGCQFMYFGIWWHNLDANISTSIGTKACISFWNIGLFNTHSLDEFFISLEALFVLVFKVPGRYSAVSVIWLAKKNSHISFASWMMSWFLVPPIFTK